ncbi:ABC transporter substrate-binding protein [Paenibacillus cremeus]|uniref:Sugar ABC transporter substrate-binding protein n=1 Tax=Paenibacillus cremeus TaxID=2163881 RepID=A0A559KF46_9BACL|nr:sugar ABC transporter substrate-binding protein [Paenibacillus cremeus]TVY10752.1 sugar ABC transporter substrate-binding protein [Paenibacillus cremeus]
MKRWNRTALVMSSIVLALSATACSAGVKEEAKGGTSTGTGAAATTTDSKAPVKLRILWWGSQPRHDATLKALEAYTKKNPNVTFEPEYQAFDGYIDKLSTQAAARNTPDIFQMDAAWFNDWSSSNRLVDLSSVNTKDVDKALLDTGTYKGKVYAVPLGNNALGMVYNKTVFDKLGVKPPQTWDELFQLAKDIKPKLAKDQYLIPDFTSNYTILNSIQLSRGKGYPRTAEGKFNYDKDTFISFMTTMQELRKGGFVAPPDVTMSDKSFDAKLDLLGQEKVLMKLSHSAEFGGFDSLKPGSFALMPLPKGVEAGGWLKASMYWSVSPDSKNQAEAKKFIDWFINDKEAADILGTSRGTPVSKTIVDYLTPKFSPIDKAGNQLIADTAKGGGKAFDPGPGMKGGWAKFATNKEYDNITQQIMFDKMTPQQGWDEVMKLAKEVEQK